MTREKIQQFCVRGTNDYLEFLRKEKRGNQVVHVVRIGRVEKESDEPECFKLVLGDRLFNPDVISLRLTPPNREFGPKDFSVVEYDGDAKCVLVEIRNPDLDLKDREPREVEVVSDLKFLVENVRNWLEQHGAELQLPERLQDRTEPRFADPGIPLESGQREAVQTILRNPLTYVWGPPGTGKTRHVLAAAVVQMVLAGKRVGIYAPTNNAVEQAMAAVILAAEPKGVERRKFLRLGTPSTSFAKKFPEVCEVKGLKRQIEELERQRQDYLRTKEHRRGAATLNSVPVIQQHTKELRDRLDRRRTLCGLLGGGAVKKLLSSLKGERGGWEKELAELEQHIEELSEMIRRTHTASDKLNRIISALDLTNLQTAAEAVADLERKTIEYLRRTEAVAKEHESLSDAEIQEQIEGLGKGIEALKARVLNEWIESASVIGMTLDCHIGRYCNQWIPFDHAFLDEAGYAPAVKALTLLRRDLPLTFLGDQKQLGPVCEIDDEEMDSSPNGAAVVWRKSALFLDDLFAAEQPEALVADWFRRAEPHLQAFARERLRMTFRFGKNMAGLLGACVYQGLGLESASPQGELHVTCLDAVPHGRPAEKRQNAEEAEAIARYLDAHPEFADGSEESWMILTPYRNQVGLLKARLRRAHRADRVSTIHKAQGREWDTVFISVVDGRGEHNSPWFTNTTISKSGGLYVMNTAISRARKHLVLVCDRRYWEELPEQLCLLGEPKVQLITRILRQLAGGG